MENNCLIIKGEEGISQISTIIIGRKFSCESFEYLFLRQRYSNLYIPHSIFVIYEDR